MLVVLVVLAACGLAAFTYLGLERTGAPRLDSSRLPRDRLVRTRTPAGQRELPGRPRTPLRPLVLLDASLSMGAAGGRWAEARDSAARWGEVRHVRR